jgi:hypothetical protein
MKRSRENQFRKGWNEALAEVREMRALGLWDRHLRACLIKDAVSARQGCKYRMPDQPQVTSYQAGYILAMKSRQSYPYSVGTRRAIRHEMAV